MRGLKPDSRDGVLEERAASPSPSASGSGDRVLLSSARGVGTALGELTTDRFSCNVSPDMGARRIFSRWGQTVARTKPRRRRKFF